MYDVTNKFNELAFARDRDVSLKAKIGDTEYAAELMSLKFTESMSSDSTIGIGETCSNYIELKMQFDSTLSLSGEKVQPSISFDGSEWCPIGTFYISEIETEDEYKTVKIKAYDQMAYLTDDYEGTATTCEGVVSYLASKHSFEVADTTYPSGELVTSVECTEREMLGYIAGLMGKNARFNRDGKLEFTWFKVNAFGDVNQDTKINSEDITYINDNLLGSASKVESESILGRLIVGKAYIGAKIKDAAKAFLADVNSDGIVDTKDTAEIQAYIDGTPYDDTLVGQSTQGITEDEIYLDGVKLSGCQQYTISCLISGTEDNVITSGSGRSITFTNPFMTQTILDGLVSDMLPFSYYTGEIQYRGNPAFECGDVVRMKKLAIPIMQQEFDFDGGMDATIESYGLSDESIKLDATPSVTKTLERKVSSVQKVVEEINDSLLSGDKGYMVLDEEVIDGVKRLSGFKIMDTPSVSSITKGWQASKNGIGWSSDGFKTISKLGLDMANGKIYADEIAAGSILTNSFQIGSDGQGMTFDGSTGKITFGSNVSMSWSDITDAPSIPTSTSDLTNDSGYINSSTATSISQYEISTATIRANQVSAGSFTMTGGSINISTTSSEDNDIVLSYGSERAMIAANGFRAENTSNGTLAQFTSTGNFISRDSDSTTIVSPNYVMTDTVYGDSIYMNGSKVVAENTSPTFNTVYCDYLGSSSQCATMVHTNNVCIYTSTTTSNAYCGFSSLGYLQQYSGSSQRYKTDIHSLSDELKDKFRKLYDLEVKNWKYNDDYLDENDELWGVETFGLIAEDVESVLPEAVTHKNGLVENYRDRHVLNALLFLVQEQHAEIDELKKKVEALS